MLRASADLTLSLFVDMIMCCQVINKLLFMKKVERIVPPSSDSLYRINATANMRCNNQHSVCLILSYYVIMEAKRRTRTTENIRGKFGRLTAFERCGRLKNK